MRARSLMLSALLITMLGSVVGFLTPAEAYTRPKVDLSLVRQTDGQIQAGQLITFRGKAPSSLKGRTVKLSRRDNSSGSWSGWGQITSTRIRSDGTFTLVAPAIGPGTDQWKLTALDRRHHTHVSKAISSSAFGWVYLYEMSPIDDDDSSRTSASVGGVSYSRSIVDGGYALYSPNFSEWNLGYKCLRFEASVGVSDSSHSGNMISFRATIDGVETNLGAKGLGPAAAISLDVTSKLRIRLTDTYVAGDKYSNAVWGDARLLCSARP